MICPFCDNEDSIVIHTQKFHSLTRRVRACQKCGMPWRTYEDRPACPDCGNNKTDVVNSEKYEQTVQRTRKCRKCLLAWKTFETVVDEYGVIDFDPHIVDEPRVIRRRKDVNDGN